MYGVFSYIWLICMVNVLYVNVPYMDCMGTKKTVARYTSSIGLNHAIGEQLLGYTSSIFKADSTNSPNHDIGKTV